MPKTFADKALALCLLTTDCDGAQIAFSGERDEQKLCVHDAHAHTGRIPLLDPKLVRVECVACAGTGVGYYPYSHQEAVCLVCQGRGWTPSTDPWAYVRAAWLFLPNQPQVNDQTPDGKAGDELDIPWAEGTTHTVTILRAVAQALVAQGAELGGKEKP